MKRLLVVAMLLTANTGWAETLVRAEKMTNAEISQLKTARDEIASAQHKFTVAMEKIAAAHNMEAQTWMEWSTRVIADGDYILLYSTNFMQGFIVK